MRLALSLLLGPAALLAQAKADAAELDPARDFFARPGLVRVRITLDPGQREQLRQRPREYVPATLHLDRDRTGWPNVAVKLKGAAGSFRKIDDRPGFTVNLGKFGESNRLHGLRRFHLNNGVQDESRLCEWLDGQLFAAAGYPAPRVSHALVWLDGEPLGLYVLREGYDKQFLMRTFGTTAGNLYDGGFCRDIDRVLEKDAGSGPDDHSDLVRLREACRDFDPERTTRLESVLDIDAFADFMALEAMIGHWDGYSGNRNNFRLWCGSGPERSRFLPHGMDQLFGEIDASVLAHPSAIAASTVQQHGAWRQLYRERLKALLPLFRSSALSKKIKARAAPLQKALKALDRDLAARHKRAVRNLISKVEARYKNLQKQVKAPEPEPLTFRGDQPIRLTGWRPAGETDHITLKKRSYRGTPALFVECTSAGQHQRRGAFRTSVLLAQGRYRFTTLARCQDVERLRDRKGELQGGVAITVLDARSDALDGDSKWAELACEFEVEEYRRSVELRLEFAAGDGKGWFRADSPSLQLLDER